jgi:predicted NAD/FAD-dependent oxidoreductase
VLATAPEEASALLATLPAEPPVRSAAAVLALTRSEGCLTVLARYGPGAPVPEWDVCYPEGSRIVQLVSHDSAKRWADRPGAGRGPGALTLVIQAHPGWSRRNEDAPGWPAALLAEAARLLGDWAARPELAQAHVWRHARTPRSGELAAPMLLALAGGARLGLCGDRFGPGGGVEAAVVSGWKLAERILSEAGGPTSSTRER